jgi:hypothetical protein
VTTDYARELRAALRRTLHDGWQFTADGDRLLIQHRDRGSPYNPPRRTPDWADLLDKLETAFAAHGVPKGPPLPIRWGRETDLVCSAVQALDPHLKHRQPFTYRTGYLPQPVVRLTGKRDADGRLLDGYLTSFVNVSRVEPIPAVTHHAQILDDWIGVLSQLGLHARHIEIYGNLRIWKREPVEGITLRYQHAGLELGDIVLLWNTHDPSYIATDLGTGLERLRWTITRQPWAELIHGSCARISALDVLDAIRTAALLVGTGIPPGPRGPGSAVRRLLRNCPRRRAEAGLGRIVREAHGYWALTVDRLDHWADATLTIEQEILGQRSSAAMAQSPSALSSSAGK